LQVLRGEVEVSGRRLVAGDGAAISDETAVQVGASTPSEVMLFDLA
jgi:redox-sensitive bicupin YhaK (pirin superfamily)